MVLPIIGVFLVLKKGLEQEKIDKFRLNYRPHLRILSGAFIITLTLNLLFESYGFTMDYLILSLLGEVAIIGYLICRKRKETTYSDSEETTGIENDQKEVIEKKPHSKLENKTKKRVLKCT